jgi:adenylate cyclase
MILSKLSPKTRRNISRIIPFGLIWLFLGWIFLINDLSLIGNQDVNSDSAITISVPIFIFASLAVFLVGLIIGTMEMIVFEKRFTNYSLPSKIAAKFLIYSTILLMIILITFPIAGSIEQGVSPFHPTVLSKMGRFLSSLVFLNTALQLSFELFLSLIYAAISENLGHNILKNFFTGRYHTPKVEKRIFMFLDMKNSTAIAEKLGHVTYFQFLRKYYESHSDSIINHLGEVYQYVGDEIVLTWELKKGVQDNHWLRCYFELKKNLNALRSSFENEFGVTPDFRAGVHVGEVTTGEIGALKKEIVYTVDVLNTAARLQNLCKEYSADLIFSEDINGLIYKQNENPIKPLGKILLQGKSNTTTIYTIENSLDSNR